eukprot:PhF_6_TR7986/c0_g1_i1/m.12234
MVSLRRFRDLLHVIVTESANPSHSHKVKLFSTLHKRGIDLLIISSCSIFLIASMRGTFTVEELGSIQYADDSVSFLFALDFLTKICSCPSGAEIKNMCLSGLFWLEVIALLPSLMDMVTWSHGSVGADPTDVMRISRFFRIGVMMRGHIMVQVIGLTLRKSYPAFNILFFFIVVTLLMGSTAMYYAELIYSDYNDNEKRWYRQGVVSPFQSIFETMWWCITTITTTGYGNEDVPVSTLGKVVGGAVTLTGVIIIAMPISVLTSTFNQCYHAVLMGDTEDDTIDVTHVKATFAVAGPGSAQVPLLTFRGSYKLSEEHFGEKEYLLYPAQKLWKTVSEEDATVLVKHRKGSNIFTIILELDTDLLKEKAMYCLEETFGSCDKYAVTCRSVKSVFISIPTDFFTGVELLTDTVHEPGYEVPVHLHLEGSENEEKFLRFLESGCGKISVSLAEYS